MSSVKICVLKAFHLPKSESTHEIVKIIIFACIICIIFVTKNLNLKMIFCLCVNR